jgi:hypothetical protein
MNTVDQLRKIVHDYSSSLSQLTEEELSFKPSPTKWSKREILGHLIDSAQNNIRRFVVSQYEQTPKIIYSQDTWVLIADYQHYPTGDLINLWILLNKHICVVLAKCSEADLSKRCFTNGPEALTIKWLAEDYTKHLLHHLHQILELEPVAYP